MNDVGKPSDFMDLSQVKAIGAVRAITLAVFCTIFDLHCHLSYSLEPSISMRAALRLLAVPSGVGTQSAGLKQVPPALLPPIPLYRRLLRAHRKFLPAEMRVLGDEYIKSEFRAHRDTDNPVHIVGFLTEWQTYAQQIEGENWRGEKMDKNKVDKMSGMYGQCWLSCHARDCLI